MFGFWTAGTKYRNNNGLWEGKKKDMEFYKNVSAQLIAQFNDEQKSVFYFVSNSVEKMAYIDGSAGTGKTFLYKTLIYYF